MLLKLVGCLCISFSILGVRSQRAWGSSKGGHDSGFSNFWNSNGGFYNNNNKPYSGNVNNGRIWGPNNHAFGGKPNEELSSFPREKNWGYETSSNSDKNSSWVQSKPAGVSSGTSSGWQAESSRIPNDNKISSVINVGSSLKWNNTNSNSFPSSEDNNSGFSSWESNDAKPNSAQKGSQNSKPEGDWYSNDFNSYNIKSSAPNDNEIVNDSEYEDKWISSSWGSNKNKKMKPTSNTFGGSGNWESTTQKNNKNSGTSIWETSNNKKPHKPSGTKGWDSNDSPHPGREIPATNPNGQNEKMPSTVDISILDELDKNDWYFGKESNYPNPPFESTLNIDVSELWNFSKNKKSNQNSRGNSGSKNNNNNNNNNNKNNYKVDITVDNKHNNNNNNKKHNYNNNNRNNNNGNNNRRRNREAEAEKAVSIQCECVDVNLCEEEDMVITQEDIKFDLRPLKEFRCEKITEVCCTNPKMKLANRGNFNEEKQQLRCGQRRLGENPFAGLGGRHNGKGDIAQPGEFPWNLRLEGEKTNCSASLIHHKMVLTAAHCVIGAQPDQLAVKAGIWSSNNEPSQSRKIIKIIPHPAYNSRNPRNDIALLILETPFELTDNVNTICLPVTSDEWDPNQCEVAGWRPEEIHGQIFEVLEKGVVNFLPQPECQNIMLITDLWRNYILHDSFVCGLKKTGRKSCTGDEGSFVVCPSKKTPDTYVQIGIVSTGLNCDEFGRPGIFTNVLKFLDWINKNYFELGLFDDIDIRSLRTLY